MNVCNTSDKHMSSGYTLTCCAYLLKRLRMQYNAPGTTLAIKSGRCKLAAISSSSSNFQQQFPAAISSSNIH